MYTESSVPFEVCLLITVVLSELDEPKFWRVKKVAHLSLLFSGISNDYLFEVAGLSPAVSSKIQFINPLFSVVVWIVLN